MLLTLKHVKTGVENSNITNDYMSKQLTKLLGNYRNLKS